MRTSFHSRSSLLALGLAVTFALAGCAAAPAGGSDAASAVTITDAWVKATDSGMTAAFGQLHNSAGEAVTVVSVQSPASGRVELHETVANAAGVMEMRRVEGGFAIPAGGDLTLEPGGNHIMMMDLAAPIEAGAEVTVTLTFSDDSTLAFTAPAKDYSGANENYGDDHGDHDHGDAEDHGDH